MHSRQIFVAFLNTTATSGVVAPMMNIAVKMHSSVMPKIILLFSFMMPPQFKYISKYSIQAAFVFPP